MAQFRIALEALTHLVAAQPWHHHVEQDQVRLECRRQFESLVAVARDPNLQTRLLHQELERGHNVRLVIGDQDPFGHQSAPACTAFAMGNVNEKVAPRPCSLSTHRSPPNWRTISREIGRPSPNPPGGSVIWLSAWRNFSNIAACCSRAMPTPLSRTCTRTVPRSVTTSSRCTR